MQLPKESMPKNNDLRNSKTVSLDILRILPEDRAFHFYKGIGVPTGVKANSLEDFARKVGNVEAISIEFHVKRHDFESWVKMLGDATLAAKIAELAGKGFSSSKSQEQLVKTVQSRISEIKKKKK